MNQEVKETIACIYCSGRATKSHIEAHGKQFECFICPGCGENYANDEQMNPFYDAYLKELNESRERNN